MIRPSFPPAADEWGSQHGHAPALPFEAGLCSEVGGDEWFPERGDSTKAAKAMCARCPVREPCLDYALRTNQAYGIWGGVPERVRRRMVRDSGYPQEDLRAVRVGIARRLAADGVEVRLIAEHLHLTEHTVSRYLRAAS